MFQMTAAISIGNFKPITATSVKWARNVDNYCDSAMIQLPAQARLKRGDQVKMVQTNSELSEGMPVTIRLGYNGNNKVRFRGFIKRINFAVPLEVECEGYSYLLRKLSFTKSYSSVTVKQLLEDVVAGTDIKLSSQIPNIPLKNIRFKNVNGYEILDYLKEKCLLSSYFNFDELYVGLKYLENKTEVRFRLGWNTVKSNDLKFQDKRELADVKIILEKSQLDGLKKYASSGPKDGAVKKMDIRHITDQSILDAIANEQKAKLSQAGYEGKITAFAEPYAEPGMVAVITDRLYPERTGRYFIEGVSGDFGPSGGRQKIQIGIRL